MRLEKFNLSPAVTSRLHFHLPPTEKAQQLRLARSCTGYFSSLKGRLCQRLQSLAADTADGLHLPRTIYRLIPLPSLREIRRTRDCGFAEVSNAHHPLSRFLSFYPQRLSRYAIRDVLHFTRISFRYRRLVVATWPLPRYL